jgi:endonuclease YncB( thermonuclease family)
MFPLRSIGAALSAALACPGLEGAGAEELPGPIPATVVEVIDGDTLEVRARIWLDQEVTTAVRLKDIQAPEIRRPPCPAHKAAGEASKAFVETLGLTEVTLADVEHDKYGGRVAARVLLPDGRDLSALLLETGHAWPYGADDALCPAPPPAPGPAEE